MPGAVSGGMELNEEDIPGSHLGVGPGRVQKAPSHGHTAHRQPGTERVGELLPLDTGRGELPQQGKGPGGLPLAGTGLEEGIPPPDSPQRGNQADDPGRPHGEDAQLPPPDRPLVGKQRLGPGSHRVHRPEDSGQLRACLACHVYHASRP